MKNNFFGGYFTSAFGSVHFAACGAKPLPEAGWGWVIFVNAAKRGEYGFHKVRTAVRLVIDGAQMRDMEVGEWPRR